MTWMVAVADWRTGQQTALDGVIALGLGGYCPKYRERTVVKGKVVWSDKWLLGRYLFVAFNDAWRTVFQARGVVGVLKSKSALTPGLVPDIAIQALMDSEVKGYVPVYSGIRNGQRVYVSDGPFAGLHGIFESVKDDVDSYVWFNIFGRQSRTTVASDLLTLEGDRSATA